MVCDPWGYDIGATTSPQAGRDVLLLQLARSQSGEKEAIEMGLLCQRSCTYRTAH